MHRATALTLLAATATLCACDTTETSKDVPTPALGSGKADAADKLDRVEGISIDSEATGSFSHDLEFHGYVVRLPEGAEITAEVTHKGSSSKLDTTLFVFGPNAGGGFGDDAIAFDDDDGWGALSRIRELSIEDEGDYLVVVGTVPGDKDRGHYRLTVECTNGACGLFDPVDLETCDDGVAEFIDECIADMVFDTQDAAFAIETCTEDGNFSDIFDLLCHGSFTGPDFCEGGLTAYMDTMVPVCQEDFQAELPQTDLDLSGLQLSDEMDEFVFVANDCDFCEVEVDAWTYVGEDPSPLAAGEAVRTRIDFGFEYSNQGEVSEQSARLSMNNYDEFVSLANEMADSTEFEIGMLGATFVPFANVDQFVDRMVLVYPETNTIVTLEESVFFD